MKRGKGEWEKGKGRKETGNERVRKWEDETERLKNVKCENVEMRQKDD